MKTYKIIKHSSMWSTTNLMRKVEKTLEHMTDQGWEIVTVSFGMNLWYAPTAYITFSRQNDIV